MPADAVQYSEKYYDDKYEYRLVSSLTLFLFRNKEFRSHLTRLAHARWVVKHFFVAFPFRHVIVSQELARQVPKTHLMSESEWRNLGVQQSPGWVHYMMHTPGKYSLWLMISCLFLRLFKLSILASACFRTSCIALQATSHRHWASSDKFSTNECPGQGQVRWITKTKH